MNWKALEHCRILGEGEHDAYTVAGICPTSASVRGILHLVCLSNTAPTTLTHGRLFTQAFLEPRLPTMA